MRTDVLSRLDHLVLDCDGTVYVGEHPVPGTAEVVTAARAKGMGVLFVSNDPTNSAEGLAARIRGAGIAATAAEVLHAGRAAAHHVASLGAATVLVAGTAALAAECRGAGVEAFLASDGPPPVPPDALLVGGGDAMTVADLECLVDAHTPGMPLVTANPDRTYPGPRGRHMGCGALAAAVAYATGLEPVVTGKPSPVLFAEARRLLGPGRIGILGDDLVADVAGGRDAGWTTIWLRRPGAPPAPGVVPDVVVDSPAELLEGGASPPLELPPTKTEPLPATTPSRPGEARPPE